MSYAFSADSATSPAGHEVTTALSTLQALAADPANREDLSKFTVFIRGVLDFAERLSVGQVTTLFTILCQLTVDSNVGVAADSDVQPPANSHPDSDVNMDSDVSVNADSNVTINAESNVTINAESNVAINAESNVTINQESNVATGSGMINELFILVRKYLGMKDTNHQRMGVLGCCAILRFYRGDEESTKNLFLFCLKSTRNLPEMRLFFYQQLLLGVQANHFPAAVNRVDFCPRPKA